MIFRSIAVVAFVLTLGILIPQTTTAATLLDQAPGGSWGVFSDESFDLANASFPPSQSVAENFQVITGDAGFLLDEVVIWGGFEPFGGSTFPLWDDVDVLVHADDNGLPGTVLCAQSAVQADRQATGSIIGANTDEYRVTLTLDTPCGLSDGTYWIEVYYNTGFGYDDWFWEFGALDPVYGLPHMMAARENPGVWWDSVGTSPAFEGAVQLNGTLGTVTCVDNPASLQAALIVAEQNGAHDVIQVVQGIYPTPGSSFTYDTPENYGLQLLGGFTAGCTDRLVAPVNTILDGQNNNPVLALQPEPSTNGRIHVQGFTITNGDASGSETAGLLVGGAPSFGGLVTIEHNAILDNQADLGVAGIQAETANGLLDVSNNLIAGNTSAGGPAAGFLSCSGEVLWLVNNTVADNSCTGCTGGLELGGTAPAQASNNILFNNDNHDLVFTGSNTVLINNDIGSLSGSLHPSNAGNISLDPLFFGGDNYRLTIPSPAANAGTDNPAGGLPAYDLDGRQRAKDGHVDMGAYEIPPILVSGFEDPLLGEWSLVVGLGG